MFFAKNMYMFMAKIVALPVCMSVPPIMLYGWRMRIMLDIDAARSGFVSMMNMPLRFRLRLRLMNMRLRLRFRLRLRLWNLGTTDKRAENSDSAHNARALIQHDVASFVFAHQSKAYIVVRPR